VDLPVRRNRTGVHDLHVTARRNLFPEDFRLRRSHVVLPERASIRPGRLPDRIVGFAVRA
jgi:hypothetical protein